jgi:hypothetical protein
MGVKIPSIWVYQTGIICRWIRTSAWLLFKRWEVWGQHSATPIHGEQGNRSYLNSEDAEASSGPWKAKNGREPHPSLKPRLSETRRSDLDGERDYPERVNLWEWFTEILGSD